MYSTSQPTTLSSCLMSPCPGVRARVGVEVRLETGAEVRARVRVRIGTLGV